MNIRYDDLDYAFQLASADLLADSGAFLDRETGDWVFFDDGPQREGDPRTPEDLLPDPRYLAAPTRQDLDLGTDLAFDFTDRHLPDARAEVRAIFSRRGAWGRFKDLLDRRDRREAWHRYEEARTRAALIGWAEGQGLRVIDAEPVTVQP